MNRIWCAISTPKNFFWMLYIVTNPKYCITKNKINSVITLLYWFFFISSTLCGRPRYLCLSRRRRVLALSPRTSYLSWLIVDPQEDMDGWFPLLRNLCLHITIEDSTWLFKSRMLCYDDKSREDKRVSGENWYDVICSKLCLQG